MTTITHLVFGVILESENNFSHQSQSNVKLRFDYVNTTQIADRGCQYNTTQALSIQHKLLTEALGI